MNNKMRYTLGILGILFVVVIIGFVFIQSQQRASDEVLDNAEKPSQLFYIEKNNIFSYDVITDNTIQLTNYPINPSNSPTYDSEGKEIPSIYIESLNMVDKNNIGFSKCVIKTGDYGCGIYALNLVSNEITELQSFDESTSVLSAAFFSLEKFAYNTIEDNKEAGLIFKNILNNNSVEAELDQVVVEGFGRDGHPDDSNKLEFSRDGNSLFNIMTSSPRGLVDFNIYVYNLKDSTRKVIPNSTQPVWVNDSIIMYRGANTEVEGYIYTYNLLTDIATQIVSTTENSRMPQFLDESNIIFEEMSRIIHLDLESSNRRELVQNSSNAVILSRNTFIFNEVIECEERGCSTIPENYKNGKVRLFNLDTNEVTDLSIDLNLTNSISGYSKFN